MHAAAPRRRSRHAVDVGEALPCQWWLADATARALFVRCDELRIRRWLHDDRLHVLRYPILRRPRRRGIRLLA